MCYVENASANMLARLSTSPALESSRWKASTEEQLKLCSIVVFMKIFISAGVKLIGGMSETVLDQMFCTEPCLRQCECWRASLCDQSRNVGMEFGWK